MNTNKIIKGQVTRRKVGAGILTLLLPLIPAKMAMSLSSCGGTSSPTNLPGNGNGNGNGPIQDVARQQTATINLFNNQRTATVQGYMTNAQWEGVANTIAGRLNTHYAQGTEIAQNNMRVAFNRPGGIVYIVEVNPVGFVDRKTVHGDVNPDPIRNGDGQTVHIALSAVDSEHVTLGFADIFGHWHRIDGVTVVVANAIKKGQVELLAEATQNKNRLPRGVAGRVYT